MKKNSLFTLFLSCLLLFCWHPALAAQQIHVSFDFDNHSLSGVTHYELGAEKALNMRIEGLEIHGVSVDDMDADFAVNDGILALQPASEIRTIEIAFTKKIEPSEEQRSLISQDGIVLLDLWYPLPETETLTHLTAQIPAAFYAVSEADKITYEKMENDKKVSFTFPYPVAFLHFVAGPYVVHEEELPSGVVLASYFFQEDKDFARIYEEKTKEYLERFEKLIGPYPYRRYSVVENRLPTGFAMPTFTLLGQTVVRLPFIVETSLGHEVLHSWFGNAVGVDYQEGNWSEGLATYLADQAFAVEKGDGVEFRKGQLVKYHGQAGSDNEMSVSAFRGAGDHSIASQASRAVGYNKVMMIFHMLHQELGDEVFYKSLRSFYAAMKFQKASWSDISGIFEKESDKDLGQFFDQWLHRSENPEFILERLKMDIIDGELRLSFDLVQKNDPPYHLKVPLNILSGEEVLRENIVMQSGITPVSLSFAGFPSALVIDPDYDLMRRLSADEMPSVWSSFQGSADKVAVVKEEQRSIYDALQPVLQEMNCPLVNEEAFDEADMARKDILLLGTGLEISRGIFASPMLPSQGFTVDVRENPLALTKVVVLLQAENKEQVEAAVHKLRHYGKYGYLHFENGQIKDKKIPDSEQGQIYLLDRKPSGAEVGKSLHFDTIMDAVADSRVVYVGETHVNQADHLLQFRVLQAMHERYPDLAVGMEMFNRTSQQSIDSYIEGKIDERQFLKDAEYFKNWGYDYRFYRDILQFAKLHNLPVIALNLDKEIVSDTFKQGGIAGLDEDVKKNLPPERDLAMPGYRQRLSQVFTSHSGPHFNDDKISNFVQAQTLWDETMAETIAAFLAENKETKMIVIAGSGHVVKENAIPPRVARRIAVEQSILINVRENELAPEEADYVFFSAPVNLPPSPMLGVMLSEKEQGPVITGISPHGGAKKSGLVEDDVILAIDGQKIAAVEDIKISLLYKEQGDVIKVKVLRPVFLLPDAVLEFELTL